jgi:pimeloyl-ACP methyl ester carboxylesterase
LAALKDPIGANLDRIQVIKGWLGKDGQTQERIYDVAVSGGRKIEADGRSRTPVGNTVDVANATWTNTIGAGEMITVWKDPDFDPTLRAFYYVRVIEIPTPRWTAYDAKYFGVTYQREAIVAWWKGEGAARSRLSELRIPVLVANGIADVMIPAEHSFAIARNVPNAKVILYPNAGHAFLFQYAYDFSGRFSNF